MAPTVTNAYPATRDCFGGRSRPGFDIEVCGGPGSASRHRPTYERRDVEAIGVALPHGELPRAPERPHAPDSPAAFTSHVVGTGGELVPAFRQVIRAAVGGDVDVATVGAGSQILDALLRAIEDDRQALGRGVQDQHDGGALGIRHADRLG